MFQLFMIAVALLLTGVDPAVAQFRSQLYINGLTLPVGFVQDPSQSDVQYVLEQGGRIRVVKAGALQPIDFLDLSGQISSGGESGLLGLAFPPNYAASGRFYVNFTNPNGHTVVSRFNRSVGNPLVADPTTRFDLRWSSGLRYIAQPAGNHNGGHLAFGADGCLYVGMGDGGGSNDPNHLAQNPSTLLGKMLRIDVDVSSNDTNGFVVPSDNPFLDGSPIAALPEIWAFGLRNPWKFSFDDPALGGTGALIIADVGQSRYEEVNYEPRGSGGRNYGWRNREGMHENADIPASDPAYLPEAYGPLDNPFFEYDRTSGYSITGGFVYRGAALPAAYKGRYFFADFITSRVWSVGINLVGGEAVATNVAEHTAVLGGSGTLGLISAFGIDAAGEMYVVNWRDGTILRIVSDASGAPPSVGFTADGKPTLIWQHEQSGGLVAWFMNDVNRSSAVWFTPAGVADQGWRVVTTGDFNANGRPDLLWQHRGTGELVAWLMTGTSLDAAVWLTPSAAVSRDWNVVDSGDFNRDGHSDLLWQHDVTGALVVWLMNRASLIEARFIETGGVTDSDWRVVAAGDFDNDGGPDLLWQHRRSGGLVAWMMTGTSPTLAVWLNPSGVSDPLWRVVAVGDISGDGRRDLVWQHEDGGVVLWRMIGTTLTSADWISPAGAIDPRWRITAVR
jgi:glucose/arabinose dehydrogenase